MEIANTLCKWNIYIGGIIEVNLKAICPHTHKENIWTYSECYRQKEVYASQPAHNTARNIAMLVISALYVLG